jgi:hypothetical protein
MDSTYASRRPSTYIEDLRVRIWAVNLQGAWFTQYALAHDISRGGALLIGLEHELRCGDMILVQYGTLKARFRIVWLRDSEGPYLIRAAVQRLEQDHCPWQVVLPNPPTAELGRCSSAIRPQTHLWPVREHPRCPVAAFLRANHGRLDTVNRMP